MNATPPALTLPDYLTPSPEREALELGLEDVILGALIDDTQADLAPLRAYLLLDAAQSAQVVVLLGAFAEHSTCLFDGAAREELEDVAPWLVELQPNGDVWDWFLQEGYGKNWGIFLHSRLSLAKLKTQLKKFTKIADENGDTYFFKYYRPEHLNTYLPVFDADQLERFMRGIEAIYAEDVTAPTTLMCHSRTARGRYNEDAIDLMLRGAPLRLSPPNAAEIEARLAQLLGTDKG